MGGVLEAHEDGADVSIELPFCGVKALSGNGPEKGFDALNGFSVLRTGGGA